VEPAAGEAVGDGDRRDAFVLQTVPQRDQRVGQNAPLRRSHLPQVQRGRIGKRKRNRRGSGGDAPAAQRVGGIGHRHGIAVRAHRDHLKHRAGQRVARPFRDKREGMRRGRRGRIRQDIQHIANQSRFPGGERRDRRRKRGVNRREAQQKKTQ